MGPQKLAKAGRMDGPVPRRHMPSIRYDQSRGRRKFLRPAGDSCCSGRKRTPFRSQRFSDPHERFRALVVFLAVTRTAADVRRAAGRRDTFFQFVRMTICRLQFPGIFRIWKTGKEAMQRCLFKFCSVVFPAKGKLPRRFRVSIRQRSRRRPSRPSPQNRMRRTAFLPSRSPVRRISSRAPPCRRARS